MANRSRLVGKDPVASHRAFQIASNWRRDFVDALEYAYGPLILSLLLAFVFVQLDQVQEILIVQADDWTTSGSIFRLVTDRFTTLIQAPDRDRAWQALLTDVKGQTTAISAIIALSLMTVMLFYASRIALNARYIEALKTFDGIEYRNMTNDERRIDDRLMLFTVLLPLLGLIAGLIQALMGPESGAPSDYIPFDGDVATAADALVTAIAFAGAATLILWIVLIRFNRNRRAMGLRLIRSLPGSRLFSVILGIIPATVCLVAILNPPTFQFLGPITPVAIFIGLMALGLAILTRYSVTLAMLRLPLVLVPLVLMYSSGSRNAGGVLLAVWVLGMIWTYMWRAKSRPLQKTTAVALVVFPLTLIVLTWRAPECESLSGCNLITGVTPAPDTGNRHASATAAFAAWNANRKTDPAAAAQPVRIISAQGGGLYTAYHTGYFLAYMADTDPAFADSIFAISGVSGGSVGAAAYWAVRNAGLCDDMPTPTCHRDGINDILARDYLSPVVAALLFRDFPDKIIPYSAAFDARKDRGFELEELLSNKVRLWRPTDGDPDIAAPIQSRALNGIAMIDSFPGTLGRPALLLNATDVHSGARRIAAPFPLRDDAGRNMTLEIADYPARDVSVATGAVLSARFPIVTPPARLLLGGQTQAIVDGGYFDNSGFETVADLLTELQEPLADIPIEIVSFRVTDISCLPRDGVALPAKCDGRTVDADGNLQIPRPPTGTLGTPASAFVSAWNARRDLSASRLHTFLALSRKPEVPSITIVNELRLRDFNFTLSWLLSQATFADICRQVEGGTCSTLP